MVCPTRQRVDMLQRMMNSIFEKGSENLFHEEYFELLLIVDNDDTETINFYNENYLDHQTIKMLVRERSEWFNRDYLTYGAIKSSGDLIWGIADDIEILTHNWDKLLISKVLEFENIVRSKVLDNYYYNWEPDEMAYLIAVDCSDGDFEHYDFCRPSFPIITKEGVEKLGFFAPPEWKFWGADYAVGQIYRKAGKVFHLPDIKVAHWTFSNVNEDYVREKDTTNQETEETSRNCKMTSARYRKQENIIDAYSNLLMKKDKRRYEPSRISLESLLEPSISLYKEISYIKKAAEQLHVQCGSIVVECPKCKFEDFYLSDTSLPTCPVHQNPKLEYDIKVAGLSADEIEGHEEAFSQYEMELKCPECDYLVDLEKELNSCPNPQCDYVGKFDFMLEITIDFRLQYKDLIERYNRLAEKYAALQVLLSGAQ